MTTPEKSVEEISHELTEQNMWTEEWDGSQAEVEDLIITALQAERQKREENIPVGFLRQFINERTPEEHKNLLTNEDIMRFIKLGYKARENN